MTRNKAIAIVAGVVAVGAAAFGAYYYISKRKKLKEEPLDGFRRGEDYERPRPKSPRPEPTSVGKTIYEQLAEIRVPEDDADLSEEEQEIEDGLAYDLMKKKESTRKPRIISFDESEGLDDSWDKKLLYYYVYDDTLMTEDDEDLLEGEIRELTVGDCLEKYGFTYNKEAVIFVQNFKFSTVYEVEKVWGSSLYEVNENAFKDKS